MAHSIFRWLGPLVFVFAASACVSVLPEPKAPDALYRINAPLAKQALPMDILVRAPAAPQIAAGQAIISEDPAGAIRLVPDVEWAGRSTRLLQLALVESFSLEGEGTASLSDSGLIADYNLLSRIETFALRGDEAVCEMTVLIAKVSDASVLERAEIRVTQIAQASGPNARALAMKRAAEECVAETALFASQSLQAIKQPGS